MNSFFLSRSLPPNSEGSAEHSEAIGASLRTQVKIFFRFCSHLPLPPANAATLAKAKRLTHFYSVALLLEKRFACFPCPGTAFLIESFSYFTNTCFPSFGDDFLLESLLYFPV